MSFAVIRHPDVAGLGTAPAEAIEQLRANGWVRVSEYRAEPGDFHLPDFADASDDLDAVAEESAPVLVADSAATDSEPDAAPAKATSRKTPKE